MTRKKLSTEEAAIQRQKALDRRREASRLWRTRQLEERQAKQVQEASQNTAITILKIETPSQNKPFKTDNEDGQAEASTSCVQSVSGDGPISNPTATGREYNLRTRKSPTPPCGSIRSDTGPDLAPTVRQNSGRSDASCDDGPLRDAREPSEARGISSAFKGKTIEGETLGLEALALSDHEEIKPTPQDAGGPTKQAAHAADVLALEQPLNEDNFTTWEEEGLFLTDLDSTDNMTSPCSATLEIKREKSVECFEQPWPPGVPTDTAQATDDIAFEAEELFYDTESADEFTPDSSEEDEVPHTRRSARLERRGHYPNETSVEPPGPLESTDFLERQAGVYRNIMKDMFAYTCQCKYPT